MINGQVGISTVPPELVRDMLPPGVLQHTFDITIQAPGVAAFNTPLCRSLSPTCLMRLPARSSIFFRSTTLPAGL